MSGGNNNITVAIPGEPNWGVWWINGLGNFQLDIVGFLAVLGEGSVLANAQVSALSRLFYLPRILPAPQALLYTTRPTTLPPKAAYVSGVKSGNLKDHVHHVANILLGQDMKDFTVRCVEVTKAKPRPEGGFIDRQLRGQPNRSPEDKQGVELKQLEPADRKRTKSFNKNQTIEPPLVKAKALGPLGLVTLIGFLEAVVLFVVSIVFGDGMSIVATILLALLSTVIGAINKWTLELPQRKNRDAPPGDAVIRYLNGSFLVVKCKEDIARELYFAPEKINYTIKDVRIHRALALLGTLMLMGGIVCLANAKLQLQLAWLGAYVIINIAHWFAAALPHEMHWDLSCYEVKEHIVKGGPECDSFTEALWKAIALTKTTEWVGTNWPTSIGTAAWRQWILDAKREAKETRESKSEAADFKDYTFIFGKPDNTTTWELPAWNPSEAWQDLHKNGALVAEEAV